MSVSFGQDAAWLEVNQGKQSVNMAQVLYVEYDEVQPIPGMGGQRPAAATLHLPGTPPTVRVHGDDIERVRAWIAAHHAP